MSALKRSERRLITLRVLVASLLLSLVSTISSNGQVSSNPSSALHLLKDGSQTTSYVIGGESSDSNDVIFGRIQDVAVSEDEESLYILERRDTQVALFVHDVSQRTTCKYGSFGRGPGLFADPVNVVSRDGLVFVIEGSRITQLDASQVDTSRKKCTGMNVDQVTRLDGVQVSSACFVDSVLVGFDRSFNAPNRYLYAFTSDYSLAETFGTVPQDFVGNLYPVGAGSIHCLNDDSFAASYDHGETVLSIYKRGQKASLDVSFKEYPAPQLVSRRFGSELAYSWEMEGTYRIHEVTSIPSTDDGEPPKYLVQIRRYTNQGPSFEPDVRAFLVDVQSGEKSYVGELNEEYVHVSEDLTVSVQQPSPVPRVVVRIR